MLLDLAISNNLRRRVSKKSNIFEYFRIFSNVFKRFRLTCFAQTLQLSAAEVSKDGKLPPPRLPLAGNRLFLPAVRCRSEAHIPQQFGFSQIWCGASSILACPP